MNDEQLVGLGFSGIAVGNALLAIGSWLRAESLVVIAGQLVVPLTMAILAGMYLFDFTQYEPPHDSRMWRAFPTVAVILGILISAVGILLLGTTLID